MYNENAYPKHLETIGDHQYTYEGKDEVDILNDTDNKE